MPIGMGSAGKLDQKVTFQRFSEADDGIGGKTQTWADFASNAAVWADVMPLYGNEAVSDGAFVATGAWIFRVRNRTDVTELDRIVWGGEPYNIRRVMRRGAREQYLTIEAERGKAQ